MDEHRFSPPAVGGSSLLISFAVLCFTIFALLALETVQAVCPMQLQQLHPPTIVLTALPKPSWPSSAPVRCQKMFP